MRKLSVIIDILSLPRSVIFSKAFPVVFTVYKRNLLLHTTVFTVFLLRLSIRRLHLSKPSQRGLYKEIGCWGSETNLPIEGKLPHMGRENRFKSIKIGYFVYPYEMIYPRWVENHPKKAVKSLTMKRISIYMGRYFVKTRLVNSALRVQLGSETVNNSDNFT